MTTLTKTITRDYFAVDTALKRYFGMPEICKVKNKVTATNEDTVIPCQVSFEVPLYLLNLVTDSEGNIHLANPIDDGRLDWDRFIHIIDRLKRAYPNNKKLKYNIYSGQPVWTFNVPASEIKSIIEEENCDIEVSIG